MMSQCQKKKKNKRKAKGALEEIENLFVDAMELLNDKGDKIVKKYPALATTIKDYKGEIERELSWMYEEANMILTNPKLLELDNNYPSIEEFIVGKGNINPSTPVKSGQSSGARVVYTPASTRKNVSLGEGKRLFEES